MPTRFPSSEQERLEVLRRYRLDDSGDDEGIQDLVFLAALSCAAEIAGVGILGESGLTVMFPQGLPLGELPNENAPWTGLLPEADQLQIPDLRGNARTAQWSPTQSMGIRLFAATPLCGPEGIVFGFLFVMGLEPRALTGSQSEALRILGRTVMGQLEQRVSHCSFVGEAVDRAAMFLEAHADSSIDGILVVDKNGRKILQNRRMNELWKIPPEIADDLDDSRQIEHVMARVRNPNEFGEKIAYLYAHPGATDRTEVYLTDGTILDRYSSPVIDRHGVFYGRVWTFRDVTESRNAEQALRESEERLRTLAESIPQLVFVCRLDGWNTYFNQRWADYTGMTVEESSGHGWTRAFHPDDQSHGSHASGDNGAYEVECRLRRRDGCYRWFLIRGQPLRDADGAVVNWFGTCTDIHDLKCAEEALQQAREELESRVAQRTEDLTLAIQEAERANRAKSEFLSRMSHELRTPLNAILGFGQVLELELASPHQQENVQHILKGGRHLLTLINEVLDIAGVESGRLDVSIEPVQIAAVVAEAGDLVLPLATQRGIRITDRTAEFGERFVLADNQRLKQVLINLFSNGIKYNRVGGRLEITCKAEGERVFIEVRDTGIGISAEAMEKLFTPFERLGAGSDVEGSGLGLVLARSLVTAMDGTLEVESIVGRGSVFRVGLPATEARCDDPAKNVSERGDAKPARQDAKKFTVLCIEDNVSNLRLLEVIFGSRPEATMLAAMQGSVGFDLAAQHHPDVILLDLNLPDMPGRDVLLRLKADPATCDIPVVVISADATTHQIARLHESGCTAYLTKPIDVREFLRVLNGIIDSKSEDVDELAA